MRPNIRDPRKHQARPEQKKDGSKRNIRAPSQGSSKGTNPQSQIYVKPIKISSQEYSKRKGTAVISRSHKLIILT